MISRELKASKNLLRGLFFFYKNSKFTIIKEGVKLDKLLKKS